MIFKISMHIDSVRKFLNSSTNSFEIFVNNPTDIISFNIKLGIEEYTTFANLL